MERKLKDLKAKVMDLYDEWQDEFGYGPCGEVACLLREAGYGKVALAMVPQCTPGGTFGTPHYVVLESDGQIVDISLPWDAGSYDVEEILEEDEYPELVTAESVDWWRDRI